MAKRRVLRWPPFEEEAAAGPPLPTPEEEFAAAHIQPFVPAADLERVARRVLGVHSVRVVRAGDEPVPERVRVVCQAVRRTRVAKDIQSAWFTLWDLYVPRSAFVVTPVRSRLDLLPDRRRLQLCRVAVGQRGQGVVATVHLWWHGRVYEGRSAWAAAPLDPFLPTAEAAVAAVAQILLPEAALSLREVRRLRVGGEEAFVAALGTRRSLLLGVALCRGDPREAVARAVLDASNRLLARGSGAVDEAALPDAERGLEDAQAVGVTAPAEPHARGTERGG